MRSRRRRAKLVVPRTRRPASFGEFVAAAHMVARTYGPLAWRLPLVLVMAAVCVPWASAFTVATGDLVGAGLVTLVVFALGPLLIYLAAIATLGISAIRGNLWVLHDPVGIAVVDVPPGRDSVRAGLFASDPVRHGLGSRLGREVLAVAVQAECAITMTCRSHLVGSYERFGFRRVSKWPGGLVKMRRDPQVG